MKNCVFQLCLVNSLTLLPFSFLLLPPFFSRNPCFPVSFLSLFQPSFCQSGVWPSLPPFSLAFLSPNGPPTDVLALILIAPSKEFNVISSPSEEREK